MHASRAMHDVSLANYSLKRLSVQQKTHLSPKRLPRDAFAVTVLSAQLNFVTKKNIKEAAPVELDAAILSAHIQSRNTLAATLSPTDTFNIYRRTASQPCWLCVSACL